MDVFWAPISAIIWHVWGPNTLKRQGQQISVLCVLGVPDAVDMGPLSQKGLDDLEVSEQFKVLLLKVVFEILSLSHGFTTHTKCDQKF